MLVEAGFFSEGRVAVVYLRRPHALNALDGELLDALDAALDNLVTLPDLRAVILTGSEACFSVGADLKEPLDDVGARVMRMHGLVERLATFPAVSIAAIEGWALGGGLELAMACTFRVAAPGAKLGLPEIKLGAIPSYGGTQLAPRLLGASRALELLCFGDPIDAERAVQIGLVNWLAEAPGEALMLALGRAAMLAERTPLALGAARRAVREGEGLPLDGALKIEETISTRLREQGSIEVAAAFRAGESRPLRNERKGRF